MLSLSFSPAAGVGPAFLPYFLCPILLAMLVLALEMGLRVKSRVVQWMSLLGMLGVIWMAFPGETLTGGAATRTQSARNVFRRTAVPSMRGCHGDRRLCHGEPSSGKRNGRSRCVRTVHLHRSGHT